MSDMFWLIVIMFGSVGCFMIGGAIAGHLLRKDRL